MTASRFRFATTIWLLTAAFVGVQVVPGRAMAMPFEPSASHHASLDGAVSRPPCADEPAEPAPCSGDVACAQLCSVLPAASFGALDPAASVPPVSVLPVASSLHVRPPHLPPKS